MKKLLWILQLIPLPVVLFIWKYNQKYYTELLLSFLPYLIIFYFFYLFFSFLLLGRQLRWKIGLIFIVVNIVGFSFIPFQVLKFYSPDYQFVEKSEDDIKIVSINLWWQNLEYEEIRSFVEDQDADILLLIEFTDLQYRNLKDFLGSYYPYSNINFNELTKPFAGNVIFSKYEILENVDKISRGYYSGFSSAVIDVNGNEYSFILVHTTAPMNEEYFFYRNAQLVEILEVLQATENTKSIIVGDFNLTPWSYYYRNFSNKMGDHYFDVSRLDGVNYTWTSKKMKFIKTHIDHMFVSKDIPVSNFEIVDFPGSDHRALVVFFSL